MSLSRRKEEQDSQYVARLFSTFRRNREARSSDRQRESRNWRAYSGVNDGQWEAQALALLRSEGRPAHTINFIQDAVDLAYGTLKQNPHKTVFEATEGAKDETVNLAQWIYDFEMDRGNWSFEEMLFIQSGLVFMGVAQYEPDYRHNPAGNIGWRAQIPWEIDPDSRWTSSSVNECRFVTKARKVPADEILARYSKKSDAIIQAIKIAQEGTPRYIRESLTDTGTSLSEYVEGDMYLVVEFYFQEIETTVRVLDSHTGQYLTGKPQMVLDLAVQEHPDRFKKEVVTESITKVVAIAPGLDSSLILAEGTYPFQLGKLPFQFWSLKNCWGERQGKVDILFDLQTMLNKRESSLTHWESLNANGSVVADVNIFPDQADRDNFERNINKPAQVFWADGGQQGIANKVMPLITGQPPTHLAEGANRVVGYMKDISHTSAPTNPNGQSNQMGANSKHYAEILSASFVKDEMANQGLMYIWAERAEGFIDAAKYIYSGPPRKLKSPLKKQGLILNQPVMDAEGKWGKANDISTLDRYDFTIEMAKEGTNKKQQDVNDIRSQMALIANPLLKTRFEAKLVEYGTWSEADKKEMQEDVDLFLKFQKTQMESQIAQMSQPPPQQPGQPMPGAKEAARAPGQGEIPSEAGIAGSGTAANNVQTAHPSDMGAR